MASLCRFLPGYVVTGFPTSSKTSPKVIIESLIPKLEPQVMREAGQSAYEYWNENEQENLTYFHHFVIRTAVECSKYVKKVKEEKKHRDEKNVMAHPRWYYSHWNPCPFKPQ